MKTYRYIGFGLLALIVIWALIEIFFGFGYYLPYGMMGFGHMSFGWMPFGMIFMVLFWFFIASAVITAFNNRTTQQTDQAKNALKERLSKGEISIQEYEEISKKLKE